MCLQKNCAVLRFTRSQNTHLQVLENFSVNSLLREALQFSQSEARSNCELEGPIYVKIFWENWYQFFVQEQATGILQGLADIYVKAESLTSQREPWEEVNQWKLQKKEEDFLDAHKDYIKG